jgi:hypothetical protein
LPTALAGKARFALAADLMLLDQGGARAEYSWKRKEKTSDECAVAATDKAGEYGCGAAERVRYSYQRPSFSDDAEKRIGLMSDLR